MLYQLSYTPKAAGALAGAARARKPGQAAS